MRIAVFGDSILWGQGLLPEQKCTSLVAEALGAQKPEETIDVISFAHSGAEVWDNAESIISVLNPMPGLLPPMGELPGQAARDARKPTPDAPERLRVGEYPSEESFTIRQIDKARIELAQAPPDVILVDAGINDVDVLNIVLPFKSRHALLARTQSTAGLLDCLLQYLRNSFPNARIVVTGYYKIVTAESDPGKLVRYAWHLLEHAPEYALRQLNLTAFTPQLRFGASLLEDGGVALDTVVGGKSIGDHFIGDAKTRLVELSQLFAGTMNGVIRSSAAKVGAVAAIPDIPDANAVFAPNPWLWGLADDLRPEDPVADARRKICEAQTLDPLKRFVSERASLGHPNAEGARAYAKAILKALSI